MLPKKPTSYRGNVVGSMGWYGISPLIKGIGTLPSPPLFITSTLGCVAVKNDKP
jgi:hypothetical protein